MSRVKTLLTSLTLVLMVVSPSMAADTSKTYTSGLLVLAFVGFCSVLVVMQLIPAIRELYLLTKDAAKKSSKYTHTAIVKK